MYYENYCRTVLIDVLITKPISWEFEKHLAEKALHLQSSIHLVCAKP